MRCPACGGDYVAGDRFCGTCGERLPADDGGASGPPVGARAAAAPPPRPSAPQSAGPVCPVCGSSLPLESARCDVCGFEPGASVVMPGAAARVARAAPVQNQADVSVRVCPVHGPLDPSWTRCPYCLREGREGRLPSGPLGVAGQEPAPPPPPATSEPAAAQGALAAGTSPASPPALGASSAVGPVGDARVEPPPAIISPAGDYQPQVPPPPSPAAPLVSPALPVPPAGEGGIPRSSVGATFVVRRRPRVLAYLIEREGEAVGRVHQLDDDVTDIGRDPRNHIVLNDVLISGFHARIERGPDGGFVAQDRNSTNGSFVNDEPLTTVRPLVENDQLRVGNTILVLKVVAQ